MNDLMIIIVAERLLGKIDIKILYTLDLEKGIIPYPSINKYLSNSSSMYSATIKIILLASDFSEYA